MAEITYHLDTLYRTAFPDLASKVLTKLDGARDLALSGADTLLGNAYQVPTAEPAQAEPSSMTVPTAAAEAVKLSYQGIDVLNVRDRGERSYLGTPIFQAMRFVGGVYKLLGTGAQQGQVVKTRMEDWRLPTTATAEFTRSKALSRTAPNGNYGSVKEMWAFHDFEITIRGLLIDRYPNTFPEAKLQEMLRWELLTDSIQVEGEMFEYLGIKRLCIDKMNISRVAGMPNVIPFQLTCYSDEPLELSILAPIIS